MKELEHILIYSNKNFADVNQPPSRTCGITISTIRGRLALSGGCNGFIFTHGSGLVDVRTDGMTSKLVVDALQMAIWRRKKPHGVIIHSDRGSQYCSHDYQQLLVAAKRSFVPWRFIKDNNNETNNSVSECTRYFGGIDVDWSGDGLYTMAAQ